MDNNKEDVMVKGLYLQSMDEEARKVKGFIVASLLKLLAFQTNMLGIMEPPKKKPSEVKKIAEKYIDMYLKEVYSEEVKDNGLKEGDSPKGTLPNFTL